MADKLPTMKEGDVLGAGHVNELSRAARKVLKHPEGSFAGTQGDARTGLPPFNQRVAIISNVDESPIVEFRLRYFDEDDTSETEGGSWGTDEDNGPYFLDENAIDSSFSVDDKIIVWWDPQRNMWVPGGAGGGGGGTIVAIPTGEPCPGIGTECDCVEAEVDFNPCGGGPAPGTIINLWAGGDILNYPPEILHKTRFWAVRINNVDCFFAGPGEAGYEYGDCDTCVWVAQIPFGLCVEPVLYTGST